MGIKIKKKKLKSISKLKREADKVFSLWIRNRDSNCYTCINGKAEQCGHYISRSYLNLRYDEKNCHGQCVGCNVFKSGNITSYALRLINEFGVDLLKEFDRLKGLKVENPRVFYEGIIKKYKI